MLEAQKLRALHAGVRRIVRHRLTDYEKRFGRPVNQEQMLATISGFSFETVRGLRQLGAGLSRKQEEDF